MTATTPLPAPTSGSTPPPKLDTAGAAFWSQVTTALTLDGHEEILLVEVCRTVDLLAVLDGIVRAEGPLVETRAGTRPHHAAVEARQQRLVLARLLATLRLPDGWSDPAEAVPATPLRRPQRRGAARGTYGPRLRNGPL